MPTAGESHPTDGVRIVLECVESDGERATYRAAIYTPTEAFRYTARLCFDGTAILEGDGAGADLLKKLENLAKSIARAAQRKADDGLKPWPPKIMRWRK